MLFTETFESVPYVMHNSDNDDEENKTKNPRPSNRVPTYLLGTTKVAKADDGFYHVTPDIVSVEKTNIPGKYKVTLVDITYWPRTPYPTSHRNQTIPLRTPQTRSSRTRTYPTRSCGYSRLCSGVDPNINTRHSTQRSRIESCTSRNDPPQNTPRRL